jgi:multiple sugar transport system permease protein
LRRLFRSENANGWALSAPGVILIGVFGLLPVLMSLQLSFQKSDLLTPETPWVGTDNYRRLADDLVFAEAIKHTLIYTALFVPGTMLVGLFASSRCTAPRPTSRWRCRPSRRPSSSSG